MNKIITINCLMQGIQSCTLFKITLYKNGKKVLSFKIKDTEQISLNLNTDSKYLIVASCIENTYESAIIKKVDFLKFKKINFVFHQNLVRKILIYFYDKNYLLPISKGEIYLWQNHIQSQ